MPVLTGPLFSLGASGTIGKTLTYAAWRGIKYARQRVVPQNPRTAAQIEVRHAFTTLNGVWQIADPEFWDIWEAVARGKPLTAKNAFMRHNLAIARGQLDLDTVTYSPGQSPIPPVVNPVYTPAAGQITVTGTAGTTPSGWTLVQAVAAAFRQADPFSGSVPSDYDSGVDLTSPFSIVLTGLATGFYSAFIAAEYESTANPSEHRFGFSPPAPSINVP